MTDTPKQPEKCPNPRCGSTMRDARRSFRQELRNGIMVPFDDYYCTDPWHSIPVQAPPVADTFTLEFERETDGRWIAEFTETPGVMAYGSTMKEAAEKAIDLLAELER